MNNETKPSNNKVNGQVSGAFLTGLTKSLLNLVELSDKDIPFSTDQFASTEWYPYKILADTIDIIRNRMVSPEILFRAGVNFVRIWYHHGPGQTMIHSGLDWLYANQSSGGYNSVVRGGERSEIGWCEMQQIDLDAGIAVYEDVTAIPPEYVRGLFYEGCWIFDDMEYVDVDVVHEPYPENRAFTRKIVTVHFRLKSAAVEALDDRIDALSASQRLKLNSDEIESLIWRYKSLRRRRSYELSYHEQIGTLLADAISQSRSARNALVKAKERIEAAASAGIIGVWEWNIPNDSLIWDEVMCRLYGLGPDKFDGTYQAWTRTLHPDDKLHLDEEIAAALRGERPFSPEFRVIWPDGSIHHIKAVSQTSFDDEGCPIRMIGVNYDLTEQKLIQSELDKMAFYDRLTNLPNRRLLEDHLHKSLARASRYQRKLALLFVDLDRFKPINDHYGHQVGDWLLQRVAERMSEMSRETDIVARIGGDEFIILLPEVADRRGAEVVAEKIQSAFERPFVTDDGNALVVSASIGISIYPDDGKSASDLIHFADVSMYRSKRATSSAATAELFRA